MNIFFVEMEYHNLHFMKKLVEDGHTVYTNHTEPFEYYKSFGIIPTDDLPQQVWHQNQPWSHLVDINTYGEVGNGLPPFMVDRFEQVLEKYKIDLVINTYPPFNEIMHLKDWGVDFVTATPNAIKLEQEKIFANSFAKHCGMKTPKILQTGDNHQNINIDSLPNQFVIKPSDKWTSATVISDKAFIDTFPFKYHLFGGAGHNATYSYYIEELIK